MLLVGIGGDLILSKNTVMTQLGHPLLKQFWRLHLGFITTKLTWTQ